MKALRRTMHKSRKLGPLVRFAVVCTIAVGGTIVALWLVDNWPEVVRMLGIKR